MNKVSVEKISKSYGKFRALDNVSFEVEGNGCLVLLGPNGAGKTTLMKTMTNIIRPTSGNVKINDINVRENPKKALMNVGSLIEQPEFYSYITGYEALMFTCMMRGLDRKTCESEVENLARLTNSKGYLTRKTREYSRGMKQRVGLASAMIGDPNIIILDEPTFGLDPSGMKEVRDLIIKLKKEKLIILSTHLLYEAQQLADWVAIINSGKLQYYGEQEKENYIEITGNVDVKKLPNSIDSVIYAGQNRIIVKKKTGARNSEIIENLIELGNTVDTFNYYSILEDLYVNQVGMTSD
ncbi:ABC transport system ATP-binding protein PA [Thermoplasma volcanium GSS1]|uniref:ABC transport system ATP-binding protein PA n=1 Tax=Thermoplasma volcanium (strain ATCC 51530 / DSM 4299 / JCM 9571 / NBRC 15438 / GSS1) TaxID=273116 RepID=Q97A22_THEVO|nr:ABC transporter ATP-binding protein [Thermoplasma volcanium]BAB60130.1 ABC transport system ATP-binding protein PA [Thermoplasma volcanium GSS1]